MDETMTTQGAPGGDGSGAGKAAADAAEKGAASGGPKGGEGGGKVPLEALHEERRKRQALTAELEQTKSQLAALMRQRERGESDADGVDLSGVQIPELTQEELDGSDAKAINAKLKQIVTSTAKAVAERVAVVEGKGEIERMLGQYEIFTDTQDPELANDALASALREVRALPKEATRETLAATVEAVARRYSKYRAEREPAAAEAGPRAPFGGGGSAEAAHLKATYERPKTREDAMRLADKVAADFLKTRKTR